MAGSGRQWPDEAPPTAPPLMYSEEAEVAEPMTLRDEDVGRIGEYVKPWLREIVEEMVPRVEPGGVGGQLLERMVRIEEELKAQRTLMDERFNFMAQRFDAVDRRFDAVDKRFEAVDKRSDEMGAHTDARFDAVDRRFEAVDRRFEEVRALVDVRFEAVDKRFEDMNARFTTLTWMIGVGFVVITSLTTVFALLA